MIGCSCLHLCLSVRKDTPDTYSRSSGEPCASEYFQIKTADKKADKEEGEYSLTDVIV